MKIMCVCGVCPCSSAKFNPDAGKGPSVMNYPVACSRFGPKMSSSCIHSANPIFLIAVTCAPLHVTGYFQRYRYPETLEPKTRISAIGTGDEGR